jgi:hypothetical protein
LLLLAPAWPGRAAAQAPAAEAAAPWPRLPDGRVLLEIKGFRVALPADPRPGEVAFDIIPKDPAVDLRRVLDDQGWARARFEALPVVWLFFQNSHNAPGRFLGRFDRRAVPDTTVFRVDLYGDRSRTACGGAPPPPPDESYRRMCERFARLAHEPPALDAHGFVLDRPDFLKGLSSTFYLFPAAERLSATGEPVFFRCHNTLGFCRSALGHLGDGYFVRPGVRLLYEFGTYRRPEAEWREADARFRAVVDDILIDAGPETRP